jgi:alkanesulfonate monooxygenase SsuD/methylene tetrahydromethanopterin reductase-like flavin-dependent oxidoreductase (luciferase family)
MTGFRVGLTDLLVYTGLGPMAMTRANYLTAAATRVDSFWVPDHLNALIPRSIGTAKYIGTAGAKLLPRPDAISEPWTALGYLAAKNRFARLRLGVGVTDAGRRNPAVTAQAAATLHLLTRGRAILGIGTGEREGNEPYGVDWSKPGGRLIEALANIRALWDSPGELVTRTRRSSLCTTPYSIYRPTAGNIPRSGSRPMANACCELQVATPTVGFLFRISSRRNMRPLLRLSARRRLTPGVTRCRSSQPAMCSW